MKCLNCSNNLADHAKYCGRCGEKIVLSQPKSQPMEDSYFSSRWKTLISLLLKLGVVDSLSYGFFVFIGFIVIEIVASLFGYCITAKSAECMGGLADIFLLPSVIGIFYFIYGSWHAIENLFLILSNNEEVKDYFGINQQESQELYQYLHTKGLHTLFLPRYAFYVSIIATTYLATKNISSSITSLIIMGAILDMRVLKYFTNLVNSAKTKSITDNGTAEPTSSQSSQSATPPDNVQIQTSSYHENKSLGLAKILKKMLKATMLTILICFVLLVILIIWVSMTTPA